MARGGAIAACSWLLGCAQVLGVDEYSKSEMPRLGGEAPFDEKAPYLTSDRCQRCIASHCSEQQAACLDDAGCADWFEAMRFNNYGPIADYTRHFLSDSADAKRAYAAVQGADPLARVDALLSCLRRPDDFRYPGCLKYCEQGRDFSCVPERFSWPATEQGSKDLLIHLVDQEARGLADWGVRYCSSQICEGAAEGDAVSAEGATDAQGFASLSAEVPDEPRYSYLLAAAPPAAYPFLYRLPNGPLHRGFSFEQQGASKAEIDAELHALGTTFEPTEALIWLYPKDCMGDPARHVTIDVLVASKGSWQPCPESECPRIYPGASGHAEVGRSELSFGPRALVTNLPATSSWLIVRDAASGAPVAMQKLEAQAGTVHVLTLYPASAAELDELAELP